MTALDQGGHFLKFTVVIPCNCKKIYGKVWLGSVYSNNMKEGEGRGIQAVQLQEERSNTGLFNICTRQQSYFLIY